MAPDIIKPPRSRHGEPPGLFHIIVATHDRNETIFCLLPATDRRMPLSVASPAQIFTSLDGLAKGIAALPPNTQVTVGDPRHVIGGDHPLRALTEQERGELRRLMRLEEAR